MSHKKRKLKLDFWPDLAPSSDEICFFRNVTLSSLAQQVKTGRL